MSWIDAFHALQLLGETRLLLSSPVSAQHNAVLRKKIYSGIVLPMNQRDTATYVILSLA